MRNEERNTPNEQSPSRSGAPPEAEGPPSSDPRWHRDFPVDWAEDEYVARRDFTKFLVLISGAFAVGQVCIGVSDAVRRSRAASEKPGETEIAGAAGLKVGESIAFNYPGPHNPCVLIRTGADAFVAYDQRCTHLTCAVQPDATANVIRCPCHEGLFDLTTGRPLAGPPQRPLPRIVLKIVGDMVYATGVEVRTS